MVPKPHKRTKVFISYSHQDSDWLKRLRIHLKSLEREYDIAVWDDTKISPGLRWNKEIEQAIQSAKVAILLVSADFLASDFIATDELPRLLKAAEEEGATILPLILSHSRFPKIESLSQFQAVNDPLQPLDSLPKSEQERILVEVTNSIEDALCTPNKLLKHITVQGVYPACTTDPNITYKSKVRIVLRNETGQEIEVKAPSWIARTGDISIEPPLGSSLQVEASKGGLAKKVY